MRWSLLGEKFILITLGTERVKFQTSLLINLLVLHTETTSGSVKGSKFFPDLSAARQKAQRRWVTMYFFTEWEGRTGKYLAWGVQSFNQKTLLKHCLWQITSSPILWCPELSLSPHPTHLLVDWETRKCFYELKCWWSIYCYVNWN